MPTRSTTLLPALLCALVLAGFAAEAAAQDTVAVGAGGGSSSSETRLALQLRLDAINVLALAEPDQLDRGVEGYLVLYEQVAPVQRTARRDEDLRQGIDRVEMGERLVARMAIACTPLDVVRAAPAGVVLELNVERLDPVAAQLFSEHSRSRLAAWIKDGLLTVDGAVLRPRDTVHAGAVLELSAEQQAQGEWVAQDIPLDIVYEDDQILVIDKPAGLVVHPGSGNWEGTLLNALLHHAPQLEGVPRAGIVHRLDKDTSGLLVVAKTLEAQTALKQNRRDAATQALSDYLDRGYLVDLKQNTEFRTLWNDDLAAKQHANQAVIGDLHVAATLPGFAARVTAETDGTLTVVAQDPESGN